MGESRSASPGISRIQRHSRRLRRMRRRHQLRTRSKARRPNSLPRLCRRKLLPAAGRIRRPFRPKIKPPAALCCWRYHSARLILPRSALRLLRLPYLFPCMRHKHRPLGGRLWRGHRPHRLVHHDRSRPGPRRYPAGLILTVPFIHMMILVLAMSRVTLASLLARLSRRCVTVAPAFLSSVFPSRRIFSGEGITMPVVIAVLMTLAFMLMPPVLVFTLVPFHSTMLIVVIVVVSRCRRRRCQPQPKQCCKCYRSLPHSATPERSNSRVLYGNGQVTKVSRRPTAYSSFC